MDKSNSKKLIAEAFSSTEVCAETEKAIPKKEDSIKNYRGNLNEVVEIEKFVNELKVAGQGQGHGSEAVVSSQQNEPKQNI